MDNQRKPEETFGSRLRHERQRLRLTLQELADQIGVSKSAVDKWELDETRPELDNLVPLSRVLGVSVDKLLGIAQEQEGAVAVYKEQINANAPILKFIEQYKPTEIFLIQYVSVNVMDVIRWLIMYAPPEPPPQIFLLIKYPGIQEIDEEEIEEKEYKKHGIHTVDPAQFDKIKGQLQTLLVSDKGLRKANLQVRCYHAPGAMRALYMGYPSNERLRAMVTERSGRRPEHEVGLLSMSMSRYTGEPGGVIGHENPLIHVYSNSAEGELLCPFFETTFLELWDASEPGRAVLDALKHQEAVNKRRGK